MRRFMQFFRKVSCNGTKTVWVLKCDIVKFFANIDHVILKKILSRHISDADIMWLLDQVIGSFQTKGKPGVGLPLGNLTSQLLVNVYMDKLDQFMKRELKVHYYVRYADDFIILHQRRNYLTGLIPKISAFLQRQLKLTLHPDKLFIKTLASGVDFLGWVHFSNHRVPRTSTRRRMVRKLKNNPVKVVIASYKGLLKHGNTYKLRQRIEQTFPV